MWSAAHSSCMPPESVRIRSDSSIRQSASVYLGRHFSQIMCGAFLSLSANPYFSAASCVEGSTEQKKFTSFISRSDPNIPVILFSESIFSFLWQDQNTKGCLILKRSVMRLFFFASTACSRAASTTLLPTTNILSSGACSDSRSLRFFSVAAKKSAEQASEVFVHICSGNGSQEWALKPASTCPTGTSESAAAWEKNIAVNVSPCVSTMSGFSFLHIFSNSTSIFAPISCEDPLASMS